MDWIDSQFEGQLHWLMVSWTYWWMAMQRDSKTNGQIDGQFDKCRHLGISYFCVNPFCGKHLVLE